LDKNKITEKEVNQVINSYLGHLSHGSSSKLVYLEKNKYYKRKEKINYVGNEVKITKYGIIKIYNQRSNIILIKK